MPATKPYKAVFAFVVTFIGAILVSVQDKTEFSDLTLLQWLIVLGFALVTTAGVYQIDNTPTGTRRNEVGTIRDALYALGVFAAALLILWLIVAIIR